MGAQIEGAFGMREDSFKRAHVCGHVYTLPLRMKPPSKMPKEALAFFREKGRIGGRTRAANLSAIERSEQARKAVRARWARRAEEAKAEERQEMTQRTAVLYARVSSREQREEGYSIEAQVKLLRAAASKDGIEVVREFIEVESAKAAGRKYFTEMVSFFKQNRSCRILLVEKTDRLYRNFRDYVTLEELEIKIYFVKEGEWLSKDSKSQVKFMHDIRLAMARNYTENQREEVKKGMSEKASQGTYPGRAPFGYINNRGARSIEIHPEKAAIAKHVFELYASGRFSLMSLSKEVRNVWGTSISKTNLHKMLTNPFYIGQFNWGGNTYLGTQPLFISPELYAQAQSVLDGHNKPKYSKHDIAFRGMLTCAHDNCTVTAELKKNKYVYYRCTGHKGPCELPRFREQEIAERMGHVLGHITIPPEVAKSIEE